MLWVSIDPAKCSGVAAWVDRTLVSATFVKPRGAKGAYYVGAEVYPSRLAAWHHVYVGAEAVVIERGFGGMATAVRSQGMHIGWHQCECARRQLPAPVEVNVSEWRRAIREDCGVTWPKDSERCKVLSVQLVSRLYGRDVGPDEADAVLLGRAALRMGLLGDVSEV